MTSESKIYSRNLAFSEGNFDDIEGQKSCFQGFLRVVLEIFRSCLFMTLNGKLLGVFFIREGRYMTVQIKT